MKDNEYQCYICHGIFEFGWSEDEATQELRENFPGFDKSDCCQVCDDCYSKTPWGHKEQFGPPTKFVAIMDAAISEIAERMRPQMEKAFEDLLLYGTCTNHPGGLANLLLAEDEDVGHG